MKVATAKNIFAVHVMYPVRRQALKGGVLAKILCGKCGTRKYGTRKYGTEMRDEP
jgi:hypothetical protein